jgi:hypothetical protein
VKGIVKEAKTGNLLESVNVFLKSTDYGAATAADGSFKISNVPVGSYQIRASYIGYNTAVKTVHVHANQTARIKLVLTPNSTKLNQLIVTGRAANLIGIASAATEVRIPQAQLNERPMVRTGDILETVPGLIITQHSGEGKANQYFLRGFNLDHGTDFAGFLQGMPLNLRTHAHGQGYLDLNFLIPELIKRIKFEKGPYYADVGDFGTIGNVKIYYKDKLARPIVKFGAGTDEWYRGLLANSSSIGNRSLLYAVEYNYFNGPFVRPENGNKVSGVLKYSGGNSASGFSIMGLAYYNNWNSSDQIPKRAVKEELITRFGAIDPSDGGITSRYTLMGNWTNTAPNNARTHVTGYMAYYRLNLFSDFTYYLDHPNRGDQINQYEKLFYGGAKVSQKWLTDWFGRKNIPAVGLQLRYDHLFNISLYNTDKRRRFNTIKSGRIDENSVGFYVKDKFRVSDKVRATLGGRANFYYFNVNSRIDVNSGHKTAFIASPKVHLVFGPWAHTEFYADFGLGYHSNDARGVTIRLDPETRKPVKQVNPLVRSRGAEIGVRTTAVKGLRSTLAFYYVGLNSEIVFDGDAGHSEPSDASRHFGIEWSNYYQLNKFLTLNLDASFTRARFNGVPAGQRRVPNSIGRIIKAGIVGHLTAHLYTTLRLRYFGPSPLEPTGRYNSKATTLVNFEWGYRFRDLKFQIDVLNIFNAKDSQIAYYDTSRLKNEPAQGVADILFHPVFPRAARFSITYNF